MSNIQIKPYLRLSGLEPSTLTEETNFVNIGERTNVTGSARFKRLILEGEYEEVQQKEQEIVQKLNEKYGPGQLDPQTGVFTPAPPQEAPQG